MARKKKEEMPEPEEVETSELEPAKVETKDDGGDSDKDILEQVAAWKGQSEKQKQRYEQRWAVNYKLLKGIWPEDVESQSKVRKRSKLYFRKIWATNWRLLSSFYNAFLRDPDNFKLDPRRSQDVSTAEVLQHAVEYRRDFMLRHQNLFLHFLWSFRNILDYGWCCGKLRWNYNEAGNKDEPDFRSWPVEQVFPDMAADTADNMRFIIFESYLTYDDLEEMGYENIDEAEPSSIPANVLRQLRYHATGDPLQNPGENEYPSPGRYFKGREEPSKGEFYCVWECFYKEDGAVKFCVTNGSNVFFKKPADSPYGDTMPDVMGTCLTEPHMLFGEGFPESLEGPQESLNANLNMRKDNVALALNRGTIVSRYGGVDLQSLINSRPGGVTLADDVNAVKERDMRDVTQSSYTEAMMDDGMMQEMSGVTPGKQGMGQESKATVANINYAESNAKIDLFIAIVAETFVKNFWYKLAKMVQRFETDETVMRFANDTAKKVMGVPNEAPDIQSFDIDFSCSVNVGAGTMGRQFDIQQTLLAMDRAVTANQSMAALLQQYQGQQMNVRMFDISKFMEKLLPKLGYKNVDEFFFNLTPPPIPLAEGGQGQGGGMMDQAMMGRNAPQIGGRETNMMESQNDMQRGGNGGI